MQAIRVEALTKTFRVRRKEKGMRGSIKAILGPQTEEIRAVHGVSFEVEEGEMLAFIGPNGAGKSTTIKMLTGILYPDGGRVEVLGIDPTKKRRQLAYQIGTVFGQKEQLWTHLTPYDNFRFFGAIYDIPRWNTGSGSWRSASSCMSLSIRRCGIFRWDSVSAVRSWRP